MAEVPENVAGDLTKKLGPLPVWAYALLLGAVAWGIYYWKRHTGSPTAINPIAAATVPPVGATGADSTSANGTYSGQVTSYPLGTPSLSTNAQWAKWVSDSAIALGYSPDSVNNTISAYLNGQTLDQSQKGMIDVLLSKFGNAPQGVLPILSGNTSNGGFPLFSNFKKDASTGALYGVNTSGQEIKFPDYASYVAAGGTKDNTSNFESLPGFDWVKSGGSFVAWQKQNPSVVTPMPTPVASKDPLQRYYSSSSSDTLQSIAQRYYGSSDTTKLAAANPGYKPGDKVVIPA